MCCGVVYVIAQSIGVRVIDKNMIVSNFVKFITYARSLVVKFVKSLYFGREKTLIFVWSGS